MPEIAVKSDTYGQLVKLSSDNNLNLTELFDLIISTLCIYSIQWRAEIKELYIDEESIMPTFQAYDEIHQGDVGAVFQLSNQTYYLILYLSSEQIVNTAYGERNLRMDEVLTGWITFFAKYPNQFINREIKFKY